MKKYVKPDLYFESFQLNQHIAACGYDYNGTQTTPEVCTFDGDKDFGNYPGQYFLEGAKHCVIQVDRYCYHNSTDEETMKIYNS